jgi:hypothetical protein
MKDAGLIALKVGLIGAVILLLLFVAMSFLIEGDIDDYRNKPHDWISDDIGFFWLLAYYGISIIIIFVSGPASTLAAQARIRTNKEALAVPAIACTAEVVLSIAAIMIYGAALSAGNLLPYFRDIYIYQITPMFFLYISTIIGCVIISVLFGYLLYAARKSISGKFPG